MASMSLMKLLAAAAAAHTAQVEQEALAVVDRVRRHVMQAIVSTVLVA